jgi:hypothetical protein
MEERCEQKTFFRIVAIVRHAIAMIVDKARLGGELSLMRRAANK